MLESAKYVYLRGYRNWISHRGAPVIPDSSRRPVTLPDDIAKVNNSKERDALVVKHLSDSILDLVELWCYPFVPRVSEYYDRIDKSNIKQRDVIFSRGSLFTSQKDHKKRNKQHTDKGKQVFAGEELAIYSIGNYFITIFGVKVELDQFLKKLDSELSCLSNNKKLNLTT